MQVVHAMAEAVENVEKTMAVLLDNADMLRTYQIKTSLSSVSSGLKCWHHFACGVLLYEQTRTLPPRKCREVCLSVSIFIISGMAANYISHLSYGCVTKGYECAWWDRQRRKASPLGARRKERSAFPRLLQQITICCCSSIPISRDGVGMRRLVLYKNV